MNFKFFLAFTFCFLTLACKQSESGPAPETTVAAPAPAPTAQQPVKENEPVQTPVPETTVPPPAPENKKANEEQEEQEEPESEDPLLHVDLLDLHSRETSGLDVDQITALNEAQFQKLYGTVVRAKKPNSRGHKRIVAISPEIGQKVIDSINEHPVVADHVNEKYDQENVKIGYCFGRATYVHLALLKMGVDKSSIRKIWIVGPMVAGGIEWQFHVAVIVKVTNGQWMVIDNFTGRLMEVKDWFAYFQPMNKGFDNLRAYITSPAKFSISLDRYDRIQLGLDLPAEKDWYKNYFVDLMKWFQDHKLEELGLRDLRLDPSEGKELSL